MVYDPLRAKRVQLTPEEWVRQHFVHMMMTELGYPRASISNECVLPGEGAAKRTDTVIYGHGAEPWVVIEFKSPELSLSADMWHQLTGYNLRLGARHLVLTNGIQQIVCRIAHNGKSYSYLDTLPGYTEMITYYKNR